MAPTQQIAALSVCRLFNDAVSGSDCVVLGNWVTVNTDLKGSSHDLIYTAILTFTLSAEENEEKLRDSWCPG
jgi:hypothetical protein